MPKFVSFTSPTRGEIYVSPEQVTFVQGRGPQDTVVYLTGGGGSGSWIELPLPAGEVVRKLEGQ